MTLKRMPDEPLSFIKECVSNGRMLWTYHVNMRMEKRLIARREILAAEESYDIIEVYPDDKYLPSCLVWMVCDGRIVHVLFALDVEEAKVRVVTAYCPQWSEWTDNMKKRV